MGGGVFIRKCDGWMFCMKESICLQPSRRGGIDGGAK